MPDLGLQASVSNEEIPLKVRKILKNGFSETSDTWIITNGLNSGVAKLASTVAAEVRSSPGFNQAALPVIGISRDPSEGRKSTHCTATSTLFITASGAFLPVHRTCAVRCLPLRALTYWMIIGACNLMLCPTQTGVTTTSLRTARTSRCS